MIKVIAGFLHQSENHFMTVVCPQLHANFKMSTKLKVERMIEDRLLAECLNIDYEASMHYQIEHEHGRGHRHLESRVRTICSNDFVAENLSLIHI